jgi:hypothetical protein
VYQFRETTCSNVLKGVNTGCPRDVLHWRTTLFAGVIETRPSVAKAMLPVRGAFSNV